MRRLAILVLMLGIIGAACSSTDERSLTVYSGRSEELVQPHGIAPVATAPAFEPRKVEKIPDNALLTTDTVFHDVQSVHLRSGEAVFLGDVLEYFKLHGVLGYGCLELMGDVPHQAVLHQVKLLQFTVLLFQLLFCQDHLSGVLASSFDPD